MKKIIELKSFFTFIFIVIIGGTLLSSFTKMSFWVACLIIGGAILINGVVIALLDKKDH